MCLRLNFDFDYGVGVRLDEQILKKIVKKQWEKMPEANQKLIK